MPDDAGAAPTAQCAAPGNPRSIDIGSVLIRGFDPFNDTVEFGRELIPRIKAGAAEIDRLAAVTNQDPRAARSRATPS
jgi:hypothetical protein